MLQAVKFSMVLLLLNPTVLAAQQPGEDTTKGTRWRGNRAVKIIDGTIRFTPEIDLGDGVRECAKISIDMTFRNNSKRPIRQIDFEIVIHSSETQRHGNSKSRISKSEKFSHHQRIPPAMTGSLLFESSNCGLSSPMRQTVRVVRVNYEDGSK